MGKDGGEGGRREGRERGERESCINLRIFFPYVSQNQHILSVDKLPVAK